MERRKFVIGAGALATGSAAAMGTGAFTSVEADRNVTVDVESDSNAYLGIDVRGGATFAQETDGVVELDFGADSGNGGSGINADATTRFGPEFEFVNQGTDDVLITIDRSDLNEEFDGDISFYVYSQETGGKESTLSQDSGPVDGGNEGIIVEPGVSVPIAGAIRGTSTNDISTNDISGDLTVYGVTDDSEAYPDAGPSTAGNVPTFNGSEGE